MWTVAFASLLSVLLFASFAQARDEFHYKPLPLDENHMELMDEGEDELYIPGAANPNAGGSAQGQLPAYSREEMMKKARGIGGEAGKQPSPEELRKLQEKYRAVKGVMQEKRFEGKPDPNQCICTMEYMPVCGVTKEGEFKTFSNKCQLKCAGAKFAGEGECQAKGGKQIKKPPFGGGTGPFDPTPLPAKVKGTKKQWEDEEGNPMPMPWENKRETEGRGIEDFNGGTPPFYPEMRMIDIEDLLNPTGPTFPNPEQRAIREGGRTNSAGQASGVMDDKKGHEEEYGLEPVSAAPVKVQKGKNKNRGAQMPPVELELKALPKMLVVAPEKAKELQNKWLPIKRATVVKVDGDALEAEEIKINEDKTLEIKAKKRAKLLGIFGVELELEAKVDAKGDIKTLKKPWWSFLAW